MTWLPNRDGRPIELVNPRVEEVDFGAMAHALAYLNRFGGHPLTPVSVGLHTLIGLDIAPAAIKPWWLLHDAHEERTGDVISPVKHALAAIADEVKVGRHAVEEVRDEFERRHDAVIHAAAGLALPTPEQCRLIKAVDLAALATERRDFFAAGTRLWDLAVEGAKPSRKVWRFIGPDRVADRLFEAFCTWLPALSRRAA